jgi:hypothetical protein
MLSTTACSSRQAPCAADRPVMDHKTYFTCLTSCFCCSAVICVPCIVCLEQQPAAAGKRPAQPMTPQPAAAGKRQKAEGGKAVPQSAPAKGPQAKTAAAGGGKDCHVSTCSVQCTSISYKKELFWCYWYRCRGASRDRVGSQGMPACCRVAGWNVDNAALLLAAELPSYAHKHVILSLAIAAGACRHCAAGGSYALSHTLS